MPLPHPEETTQDKTPGEKLPIGEAALPVFSYITAKTEAPGFLDSVKLLPDKAWEHHKTKQN